MVTSPYSIALQFKGLKEGPGAVNNPMVVAMLQVTDASQHDDATAWCSGFVNFIAWLLALPRSKSLGARSWLKVGLAVALEQARPDADVVVLSRGDGPQPGPDVIAAPGHVGFFAGLEGDFVLILGGNQGDAVSITKFPKARVLGVRRLV